MSHVSDSSGRGHGDGGSDGSDGGVSWPPPSNGCGGTSMDDAGRPRSPPASPAPLDVVRVEARTPVHPPPVPPSSTSSATHTPPPPPSGASSHASESTASCPRRRPRRRQKAASPVSVVRQWDVSTLSTPVDVTSPPQAHADHVPRGVQQARNRLNARHRGLSIASVIAYWLSRLRDAMVDHNPNTQRRTMRLVTSYFFPRMHPAVAYWMRRVLDTVRSVVFVHGPPAGQVVDLAAMLHGDQGALAVPTQLQVDDVYTELRRLSSCVAARRLFEQRKSPAHAAAGRPRYPRHLVLAASSTAAPPSDLPMCVAEDAGSGGSDGVQQAPTPAAVSYMDLHMKGRQRGGAAADQQRARGVDVHRAGAGGARARARARARAGASDAGVSRAGAGACASGVGAGAASGAGAGAGVSRAGAGASGVPDAGTSDTGAGGLAADVVAASARADADACRDDVRAADADAAVGGHPAAPAGDASVSGGGVDDASTAGSAGERGTGGDAGGVADASADSDGADAVPPVAHTSVQPSHAADAPATAASADAQQPTTPAVSIDLSQLPDAADWTTSPLCPPRRTSESKLADDDADGDGDAQSVESSLPSHDGHNQRATLSAGSDAGSDAGSSSDAVAPLVAADGVCPLCALVDELLAVMGCTEGTARPHTARSGGGATFRATLRRSASAARQRTLEQQAKQLSLPTLKLPVPRITPSLSSSLSSSAASGVSGSSGGGVGGGGGDLSGSGRHHFLDLPTILTTLVRATVELDRDVDSLSSSFRVRFLKDVVVSTAPVLAAAEDEVCRCAVVAPPRGVSHRLADLADGVKTRMNLAAVRSDLMSAVADRNPYAIEASLALASGFGLQSPNRVQQATSCLAYLRSVDSCVKLLRRVLRNPEARSLRRASRRATATFSTSPYDDGDDVGDAEVELSGLVDTADKFADALETLATAAASQNVLGLRAALAAAIAAGLSPGCTALASAAALAVHLEAEAERAAQVTPVPASPPPPALPELSSDDRGAADESDDESAGGRDHGGDADHDGAASTSTPPSSPELGAARTSNTSPLDLASPSPFTNPFKLQLTRQRSRESNVADSGSGGDDMSAAAGRGAQGAGGFGGAPSFPNAGADAWERLQQQLSAAAAATGGDRGSVSSSDSDALGWRVRDWAEDAVAAVPVAERTHVLSDTLALVGDQGAAPVSAGGPSAAARDNADADVDGDDSENDDTQEQGGVFSFDGALLSADDDGEGADSNPVVRTRQTSPIRVPPPEFSAHGGSDTVLRLKCRLGDDVRVLSIPSRVAFPRVKSRVQAKFGAGVLRFRWRDADGDLITLVTKDDWLELLRDVQPKDGVANVSLVLDVVAVPKAGDAPKPARKPRRRRRRPGSGRTSSRGTAPPGGGGKDSGEAEEPPPPDLAVDGSGGGAAQPAPGARRPSAAALRLQRVRKGRPSRMAVVVGSQSPSGIAVEGAGLAHGV